MQLTRTPRRCCRNALAPTAMVGTGETGTSHNVGVSTKCSPSQGGYTISVCNQPTMSTQRCVIPGSLNGVSNSPGLTRSLRVSAWNLGAPGVMLKSPVERAQWRKNNVSNFLFASCLIKWYKTLQDSIPTDLSLCSQESVTAHQSTTTCVYYLYHNNNNNKCCNSNSDREC